MPRAMITRHAILIRLISIATALRLPLFSALRRHGCALLRMPLMLIAATPIRDA